MPSNFLSTEKMSHLHGLHKQAGSSDAKGRRHFFPSKSQSQKRAGAAWAVTPASGNSHLLQLRTLTPQSHCLHRWLKQQSCKGETKEQNFTCSYFMWMCVCACVHACVYTAIFSASTKHKSLKGPQTGCQGKHHKNVDGVFLPKE